MRFFKHDRSAEDKQFLSFVIILDAIMPECIMSLELTLLDASSYIDVEIVQFEKAVDLSSKMFRSGNGDSILQ